MKVRDPLERTRAPECVEKRIQVVFRYEGGSRGKVAGKVADTHRLEFPPPDRDCHESDGILADGASKEARLPCQLRGSASSMTMPSGRTT